jgi:hypoxanthine-DNA glycosylase
LFPEIKIIIPNMMITESFEPIINNTCKILILGTMPGMKSLEMKQYYANERNVFWKIIFKIFDYQYTNDYEIRKNLLINNKIAIWDTLKNCQREGSLDSDIRNAEPNDISQLIREHPNITSIIFNGKYAENFYKKYNELIPGMNYISLPSTSPANARYKLEYKINAWSAIKDFL